MPPCVDGPASQRAPFEPARLVWLPGYKGPSSFPQLQHPTLQAQDSNLETFRVIGDGRVMRHTLNLSPPKRCLRDRTTLSFLCAGHDTCVSASLFLVGPCGLFSPSWGRKEDPGPLQKASSGAGHGNQGSFPGALACLWVNQNRG